MLKEKELKVNLWCSTSDPKGSIGIVGDVGDFRAPKDAKIAIKDVVLKKFFVEMQLH